MLNEDDRWHLDKKVPISIIVALFAQFGGAVWYAGRIEARVAQLEHDSTAQKARDDRQDAALSDASSAVYRRLDRIEEKLDRLIERQVGKK